MLIPVNYLAVLVAGLLYMVIGAVWYSPVMFGNLWIKNMGFTKESLEKAKHKSMGPTFAISFLSAIVMAYVLAHFLYLVKATTLQAGAITAFWAWLGFQATVALNSVLWEQKAWSFYGVNIAYQLITLIFMAMILVAWPY